MSATEEQKRAALSHIQIAIRAVNGGKIDWNLLEAAIEAAVAAGCASPADLEAVRNREYFAARWKEIEECLGKNIPAGKPKKV
ncbi:hypothetical protein [Stenotrophomonas maltophilia]|uniref:hypothetical protein n=1 Tax=Stenotrophomonas maltophilia TaxID=40324 RepID=UPI0013DC43C1|nr:hypothetical protein [Stenotrophomonas maltophilia]